MARLDPVIHPITRLKICAALFRAGATERPVRHEMKFATLRDLIDVSDATLSKQLNHLEAAGYVSRWRDYGVSRNKDVVWVSLTTKGTEAYSEHVAALTEIASEG